MRLRSLVLLVSLLMLMSGTALAQFAQRGGISGTVYDTSGAVIPGAQITLFDIAGNQVGQAKTDSSGHFEFNSIAAGQYRLSAVANGFMRMMSGLIPVAIGTVSRYDFKLKLGSVKQTVTVSSEAVPLETEHASLNTNVTERQFADLPLNGRNFTAIVAIAPGISTYPMPNINPGGTWAVGAMFAVGGTQFTAGGAFQGTRDSGYYVNGVNVNDNWMSSLSFAPSVEALQTATVEVDNFSAAFGRDIGALDVQTKRGTNKYHGSAYDFLENDAMNAINPYTEELTNITGTPSVKPSLRRNQFGGNLGGPIPGTRKKLFFFGNYEEFIEHDGNQRIYASVPSAAERNGNFSELLGTNPNPVQLYNPFFTTYNSDGTSSRPPIPDNRLDLAKRPDGSPLIDPNSAAILKLWPLPNLPGVPSNEANYATEKSSGITNSHLDTRFDANVTNKDSLFVTWSRASGYTTSAGGLSPTQLYNFPLQDQSYLVTMNYLHVFSPTLTNAFILGIGDGALLSMKQSQLSWYNGDTNPFNELFQNTGSGITHGLLAVYAGNYTGAGTGEIFRAENESLQFSDNLNWVHGRHTIAMGMDYFRKSEIDWDIQRNVYFGGFSASGSDLGYVGGDGIADLEMGIVNNMWVRHTIQGGSATAPDYNVRFPNWGLYVNDRYRVTSKLTVSAGLRYNLTIPAFTPNPTIAPCCIVYKPTADGGIVEYPGIAPGLPEHYLSAPKRDFAPRISIAYHLMPKTMIRAAYGIFFDTGATQVSERVGNAMYSGNWGGVNYDVNNSTLGVPADTPDLTLQNIFPVPTSTTLGTFPVSTGKGQGYYGDLQWAGLTYYDQNSTPVPYIQRELFQIEQQLGSHDAITLSYAGAQGRKGPNQENINLPPYQTGWVAGSGAVSEFNAARPNNSGRFGDVYVVVPNLNSSYNALTVQYKHQFNNGFQITSNYTWSKSISDYPVDNALWDNGAPGAGSVGGGFQYPNLSSRGLSTQDHPQRFVFSGIWTPQYGQAWPRLVKGALTGWRVSGIVTLESGDALTVTNGGPGTACPASAVGTSVCPTGYGSSARDNAGFDELYVSGNPNIGHSDKTFSHQFNTSVFSVPPMDVRGDSGLGTVRGPGQENLDFSIAKTFPLYESVRLDFRCDAFNALNHPQWTGINTTYPSGSAQFPFGQANGAREGRILQLSAKVSF